MANCPACRSIIDAGVHFCVDCGEPLSEELRRIATNEALELERARLSAEMAQVGGELRPYGSSVDPRYDSYTGMSWKELKWPAGPGTTTTVISTDPRSFNERYAMNTPQQPKLRLQSKLRMDATADPSSAFPSNVLSRMQTDSALEPEWTEPAALRIDPDVLQAMFDQSQAMFDGRPATFDDDQTNGAIPALTRVEEGVRIDERTPRSRVEEITRKVRRGKRHRD